MAEIAIDERVLIFAVGLCLLTGMLAGLAPALQVSGFDLAAYLKEGARAASGSPRQKATSATLVAAEFAVCLMLMTGAGLLVRSFWKLTETNPGFNPENAIVARIWLPQPNNPKQDPYARLEDRAVFVREVLRRVRSLPGVVDPSISTAVPLSRGGGTTTVTVDNNSTRAGESTLAEVVGTSPDYFKTLETPLYQGRFLEETDQSGTRLNVLVDRAAAARFWPGESPLGKRVKLGRLQSANSWATVVGLVGDIRHDSIDTAAVPHVYFSIYQLSGKSLGLVVRGGSDPAHLGDAVRREIQAVDPSLPVFGIRAYSGMVSDSMTPQRFSAQLMGGFAALALLLAAIGIYGVLAYFVGQRTREIGIRMALGAAASSVVRLVLMEGWRPIGAGLAIGMVGSLVFSRLLSQLLFGVSAQDPVVFGAVPFFLTAAAVLASYIPARQATRIDPVVALRAD